MKSFMALLLPIALAALFPARPILAGQESSIDIYRKIKPPEQYGSVVMNKGISGEKGLRPVVFPHWPHRVGYSCKACHTDLGFKLRANTTEIKQSDIEAGRYCGRCHDGKTAFGANECERCHSYGLPTPTDKKMEALLKGLPKDDFGNRVDWALALKEGKISPVASLDGNGKLKALDSDIVMPATRYSPHPQDVMFPHGAHTAQMACDTCHPSIFKDEKGGNPDMNMMKIISGQYCGVCHGRVAFPLEDCFRCHSQPQKNEPAKKGKETGPKK